jgi:ABC-type lipoprotein release transport system permease subunit
VEYAASGWITASPRGATIAGGLTCAPRSFARRRPFALLRASGVRLGELRRIVLLETGVPMIFTCMLGVALGMVTSYAFQTLEGASWNPPGLDFVALMGGALLVAMVIATTALPLLDAATRHNAVRYE